MKKQNPSQAFGALTVMLTLLLFLVCILITSCDDDLGYVPSNVSISVDPDPEDGLDLACGGDPGEINIFVRKPSRIKEQYSVTWTLPLEGMATLKAKLDRDNGLNRIENNNKAIINSSTVITLVLTPGATTGKTPIVIKFFNDNFNEQKGGDIECEVRVNNENDPKIVFTELRAEGNPTTQNLILTFDKAIPNLAVSDISVRGEDGYTGFTITDGTTLSPVTGNNSAYTLPITVTSSGDVRVSVTKGGYNITGGPKIVTLNYDSSAPPPLTGTVGIAGNTMVGQTLTANTANLGGDPAVINYQWTSSGTENGPFTNISNNATTSSYILVTGDVGKYIRLTVFRTGYSGEKTSNVVGPVTSGQNLPTPTSVSVTPNSASVAKGETTNFSATVSPSEASQAVVWSVEGGISGTSITNGILTVALGETATSLTVRATATDTSVSGTATVTVTGGGGGDDEGKATINVGWAEKDNDTKLQFDPKEKSTNQNQDVPLSVPNTISATSTTWYLNGLEVSTQASYTFKSNVIGTHIVTLVAVINDAVYSAECTINVNAQ